MISSTPMSASKRRLSGLWMETEIKVNFIRPHGMKPWTW